VQKENALKIDTNQKGIHDTNFHENRRQASRESKGLAVHVTRALGRLATAAAGVHWRCGRLSDTLVENQCGRRKLANAAIVIVAVIAAAIIIILVHALLIVIAVDIIVKQGGRRRRANLGRALHDETAESRRLGCCGRCGRTASVVARKLLQQLGCVLKADRRHALSFGWQSHNQAKYR
jgi:hypothetical protein